MADLSSALFLSLRIAIIATAIVALSGFHSHIAGAAKILRSNLDRNAVHGPAGFATDGRWISHHPRTRRAEVRSVSSSIATFGYRLLFTIPGAILAAVIVSLPLLFLPARAAFAAIEPEYEEIARLFGAGRLQTFWHVNLPLARRGIASGLLLAFARALGEFGATMMVFGNQEDRQTLPISIYQDYVGTSCVQCRPWCFSARSRWW